MADEVYIRFSIIICGGAPGSTGLYTAMHLMLHNAAKRFKLSMIKTDNYSNSNFNKFSFNNDVVE
jgi:hypothetical protein